jgi:hypothetical protein
LEILNYKIHTHKPGTTITMMRSPLKQAAQLRQRKQ